MNGKLCRYWRLVVSVVGGFYLAGFAVPALANEVSTRVNLSHYHEVSRTTTRVPPNASVSPVRDITPNVSARPGGGLMQTMPGSITIESVKTSPPAGQTLSGPLLTSLNVGKSALQAAMFACMRHIVCRAGSVAIPIGVELAMDQFGAVVDDDGNLVIPGTPESAQPDDFADPLQGLYNISGGPDQGPFPSVAAGCAANAGPYKSLVPGSCSGNPGCVGEQHSGSTFCLLSTVTGGPVVCPSGSELTPYGCILPSGLQGQPVTDDLLQQIADGYEPMPEDWNFLADSIPMGAPDVTVEVLDVPSLTGANSPNFIQNADGTSTGTYSEFEFSVRNNNSKQPIIDVQETTVVTEYDETGAVTGTSTSTSSQVGAGAGSLVNFDVPTDCAFFPTACRFFDWVMSPFDEPEPVISPVSEFDDVGREVEIGPSSGSCPAPYIIELSVVPPVEISYEPFCDLGGIVRPLLLALSSFFAAYLVVRSL